MAEDDWEAWADDDAVVVPNVAILQEKVQLEKAQQEVKQEKQQQQQQQQLTSEQKSKQADLNNVLDLFLDSEQIRDVKVKAADFKVIGENLALKMNSSAITPAQTMDLIKSLILKVDKKLDFQQWEEIYKAVDIIYVAKKKKRDEEEAKKKKQTKQPPKGLNWGKQKGQMDLNDDDAFGDEDDNDFM